MLKLTRQVTGRPTVAMLTLCGALALGAAHAAPGHESSPAERANDPRWKAVAATGNVEALPVLDPTTQWQAVRRGDLLEPRTEVRTGTRSRTTLVQRANILIVDPDSRVALPDEGRTVVQDSGSVVYEVDGRVERDFRVVTPYLVAGVKGTVFMVTVTDGTASVTVSEGVVEITAGDGETLQIEAGESVHMDARREAGLEKIRADGRRADGVDRKVLRKARADARRLAHARRDELLPISGRHANDDPRREDPGDLGEKLDTEADDEVDRDELGKDLTYEEERKPDPAPLPPQPDPSPDPDPGGTGTRDPLDQVQKFNPPEASTMDESLLDDLVRDLESQERDDLAESESPERKRPGKSDRVDKD